MLTEFTDGVGMIVIVAVTGVPLHPLATGVMVNVTVTGALVVLVNEPLMLPLPLAAIPVTETVLSLVQLNIVPLTAPVNAIVVIAELEHIVCEEGVAIAVGSGLTVTATVAQVVVLQGPLYLTK